MDAAPEPRFDRVDEAERAHSLRLFLVIGALVGPSLVLGALGYYELAAKAFWILAAIGFFVVFVYHKASELDDLSALVVGYGEGGFYGNPLVYADAFGRLLKGEVEATGKLPVQLTTLP